MVNIIMKTFLFFSLKKKSLSFSCIQNRHTKKKYLSLDKQMKDKTKLKKIYFSYYIHIRGKMVIYKVGILFVAVNFIFSTLYRLLNNLDLKFDLVGNRSVDIFSIYANYVSHEIDFPVIFLFYF